MKKTAIIKNMDKDLWIWLVGHAKQKGKTVAELMELIIKNIQTNKKKRKI